MEDMTKYIIVPGSCGCEGCIFAEKDKCPADKEDGSTRTFEECSYDEHTSGIFILKEE